MTEPASPTPSPPTRTVKSDRFQQVGSREIEARFGALALAVDYYNAKAVPRHGQEQHDVLDIAEWFWDWLIEFPAALLINIGIPFEQGSDDPFPQFLRILERGNMAEAVTLTDSQQVTVAIQPVDKKGFPVTDQITWTSGDESIVGLQVSADGYSAVLVAGAPGSTSVTPADPNGLSDVVAVTVTAGPASGLQATVGVPEEQPASTGDTSGTVVTSPPADAGSGGDAASGSGTTDGGGATTDPGTAAGPGADAGGITPPAQVG